MPDDFGLSETKLNVRKKFKINKPYKIIAYIIFGSKYSHAIKTLVQQACKG